MNDYKFIQKTHLEESESFWVNKTSEACNVSDSFWYDYYG